MSNSINNTPGGAPGDPGYVGGQTSASPETGRLPAAAPTGTTSGAPDPADLRLVIEDDTVAGTFVYKTIDRRTGTVVQQYPREQILKLLDAPDYTAGAVIKAKV